MARYIAGLVTALRRIPDVELRFYARASRLRQGHPTDALGDSSPVHRLGVRPGAEVDVFHGPDARLPRLLAAPGVVTVHDLSAFQRDDHATRRFLRRKRAHIRSATRRANRVITHAETVRVELHRELSVPLDRITAIPLADTLPLATDFRPRPLANEPDRLLIVGGPSVRKGSDRLPSLLATWRTALGWRPQVDWVGSGSRSDFDQIHDRLDPADRERVQFHGHVADVELSRRYAEADALLQLSDTEGFAIPLVEAARRRLPVISIDAPVLRETIGPDGAHFFTDHATADAFRTFLEPTTRAAHRDAAAHRVEHLSWEQTALATSQAYRDAAR